MNFEKFNAPAEEEKSEEISAEDQLTSLMEDIKEKGGVEGSSRNYSYEEIEKMVENFFAGKSPDITTITRAGGLRDIVGKVFMERANKRSAEENLRRDPPKKKNPFEGENEDLQALEEQDRERNRRW